MRLLSTSITRRLMILFFLVGLGCLSIVGVYSYRQSKQAILQRTLDQLTSIRVIKKRQIQNYYQERFSDITALSLNPIIRRKFESWISESWSSDGQYIWNPLGSKNPPEISSGKDLLFLIGSHEGLEAVYSPAEPLLNGKADSVLYQSLNELMIKTCKSDIPHAADFIRSSYYDSSAIGFVGMKCFSDKGKMGVVAIIIPISEINSIMLEDSEENGLGKSGEIYLVGPDRLMRSNSRFLENSVLRTKVETDAVGKALSHEQGSALIRDYRNIKVLSSFDHTELPDLDWAIAAEIDYREAMIPINSIRNDIIFISLLICVFLFSIAHLISQTISKPIIRLKEAAESIGEGRLGMTIASSSRDEIGVLTESFNQMSKQLQTERQQRMTALFDGQELERQRISRDLHDGISQSLFAMKLQLENSSRSTGGPTNELLEAARTSFDRNIEEIRQISNDLAPSILRDSTLESGLRQLCSSRRRAQCTSIEFSSYGDIEPTDQKVKTYLYRIAQEGLANAIRHSGAKKVQVQVIGNKESIILTIEDDGKGFNPESPGLRSGNGLYNMKERANLMNGRIDIESEPGNGCTLRVIIPKKNNEKDKSTDS